MAIAAAALALFGAAPAFADPVSVEFDDSSALTVEYAEQWGSTITIGPANCSYTCPAIITIYDNGDEIDSYETTLSETTPSSIGIGSWLDESGFGTGEHVFTVDVKNLPERSYFPFEGSTASPLTVTVTQAALTTDLRVETDPLNSENAIVTARLTGSFIDQLPAPGYQVAVDSLPAGTWKVSLTDADGAAVFEQEIAGDAAGLPYRTWYWQNVPRDTVFSGTASFTPTGDDAAEFSSTPASSSYTSPAAATVPTNGEPEVEQPVTVSAVDTVPLWAIIVSALVALASIVVLLVALLRRRTAQRGQSDDSGDGPTTDPDEPTEPAASAPETELISQSEAERV